MSGTRVITGEEKYTYDLNKMKKNNVVCVRFKLEALCTHDTYLCMYFLAVPTESDQKKVVTASAQFLVSK